MCSDRGKLQFWILLSIRIRMVSASVVSRTFLLCNDSITFKRLNSQMKTFTRANVIYNISLAHLLNSKWHFNVPFPSLRKFLPHQQVHDHPSLAMRNKSDEWMHVMPLLNCHLFSRVFIITRFSQNGNAKFLYDTQFNRYNLSICIC